MKNLTYYTLSLSGGKDSVALFLRALNEGVKLNEVVVVDLGDEFTAVYDVLLYIYSICKQEGIKFTVLTIPETDEYRQFVRLTGMKISMFQFLAFHHIKANGECGYGWCGKGIARRLAGMGAVVIVTEIDPVKALEAVMDGFTVLPMDEAAPLGDLFITATGCKDVIVKRHFEKMKDGVLLANSGHFNVEINKDDLLSLSVKNEERKPSIEGFTMADGRILNLLADGRLVNLAAGNGHPAEIMDMSFALQAKCLEYLAKTPNLEHKLYSVPVETDKEVATMKLAKMGVSIDALTPEQAEYLFVE